MYDSCVQVQESDEREAQSPGTIVQRNDLLIAKDPFLLNNKTQYLAIKWKQESGEHVGCQSIGQASFLWISTKFLVMDHQYHEAIIKCNNQQ